MCPSARLFLCARCRVQVVICRSCDRGQVYCSETCSQIRRTERQRQANARYAKTRVGQQNNAKRQAHYRARKREQEALIPEIVTDHGSAPCEVADTLVRCPMSSAHKPPQQQPTDRYCHFCNQCCDLLLRSDFLPPDQRHQRFAHTRRDTIP